MANIEKCLISGCKRPAESRGLCYVCYGAANRAVVTHRTTWDELVELDLALKSKQATSRSVGGQIKETPFELAFRAKKKAGAL